MKANAMKTFPVIDERTDSVLGFEIENAYISPSTVASVLSGVKGVSGLWRRRAFSTWDEIHVHFRYRDAECIVWEPFGDNSRYWVGQKENVQPVDLSDVERAFFERQPGRGRRIVGDMFTLRFITRFFGRRSSER
jgi:hypothetical protein